MKRILVILYLLIVHLISVSGQCKFSALRQDLAALSPQKRTELLDFFHSLPKETRLNAWKGLNNIPALRTNVAWLSRSNKWLNEGAEFVTTNGVTKLRKGAEEILEIRNGKILPIKYSSVGTPIGEVANGYQVVKNGNEIAVKRVPETLGYDPQDLAQLSGPNAHPDCHVLERHGHDVTEDALKKRATGEGSPQPGKSYAPDGDLGGIPPYSSKFESTEKLKQVLNDTKPGSPSFNPPANGDIYVFDYPLTGEASSAFGNGIPSGGGSPVSMKRVKVLYKKDNGIWKLFTMYPQL